MLNDPHSYIVISSEARNLCYSRLRDTLFPHVCRAPLHFLQLSFKPPVPYPPLRGTFHSRGRLFLYFATLRSFDSVLIFSDKPFFNTRPFSPLRMTKYAAPPPLNPLNLLNPLNHKPNESKVKRGCEEMRIHFFTAPFLDHLSLTLSAYRRSH